MLIAEVEDRTSLESIVERDQRVLAELPQVYYLASRIRERMPKTVDLKDLIQAGVIGLIEASRNYDSTKEAQFSTFAKFRIRGAILDSLREMDWGSRKIRQQGRAVASAIAMLGTKLGRGPRQEEIALYLQMDLRAFQSILSELDGLCLVGQFGNLPFNESEGHDLIESAAGNERDSPFELCLEGQRKEHVVKAVETLSEREQLVLSLYYKEELTMREIAQIMECAISRISQIHSAALLKLRKSLGHLRSNSAEDPASIVDPGHPPGYRKPFPVPCRPHVSSPARFF